MATTGYFENKEIDPRDCLYRPTPKIRKQLEHVIRTHKTKFGLSPATNQQQQSEDEVTKLSSSKVKNRFAKPANKKDLSNPANDTVNKDPDAALLDARFGRDKLVTFVEQLDSMLAEEDEQKQSFNYESLVKMHQLLQYLEEEAERDQQDQAKGKPSSAAAAAVAGANFRNQFFFQFMESNFRAIPPEKRKDPVLDERLRKLKYQAANSDYDNMTANVGRAIRGGFKQGSSASTKFTLSEELRSVRATLLAIGNAFMVILATFAFFYVALGFVYVDDGSVNNNRTGNRVLFSFTAAMIVAIAEIYFLIRIV